MSCCKEKKWEYKQKKDKGQRFARPQRLALTKGALGMGKRIMHCRFIGLIMCSPSCITLTLHLYFYELYAWRTSWTRICASDYPIPAVLDRLAAGAERKVNGFRRIQSALKLILQNLQKDSHHRKVVPSGLLYFFVFWGHNKESLQETRHWICR